MVMFSPVITGNDLGAVFTYTKIDLNNPKSFTPLKENVPFTFWSVDSVTYKNVTNGSFNVNFTQQAQ